MTTPQTSFRRLRHFSLKPTSANLRHYSSTSSLSSPRSSSPKSSSLTKTSSESRAPRPGAKPSAADDFQRVNNFFIAPISQLQSDDSARLLQDVVNECVTELRSSLVQQAHQKTKRLQARGVFSAETNRLRAHSERVVQQTYRSRAGYIKREAQRRIESGFVVSREQPDTNAAAQPQDADHGRGRSAPVIGVRNPKRGRPSSSVSSASSAADPEAAIPLGPRLRLLHQQLGAATDIHVGKLVREQQQMKRMLLRKKRLLEEAKSKQQYRTPFRMVRSESMRRRSIVRVNDDGDDSNASSKDVMSRLAQSSRSRWRLIRTMAGADKQKQRRRPETVTESAPLLRQKSVRDMLVTTKGAVNDFLRDRGRHTSSYQRIVARSKGRRLRQKMARDGLLELEALGLPTQLPKVHEPGRDAALNKAREQARTVLQETVPAPKPQPSGPARMVQIAVNPYMERERERRERLLRAEPSPAVEVPEVSSFEPVEIATPDLSQLDYAFFVIDNDQSRGKATVASIRRLGYTDVRSCTSDAYFALLDVAVSQRARDRVVFVLVDSELDSTPPPPREQAQSPQFAFDVMVEGQAESTLPELLGHDSTMKRSSRPQSAVGGAGPAQASGAGWHGVSDVIFAIKSSSRFRGLVRVAVLTQRGNVLDPLAKRAKSAEQRRSALQDLVPTLLSMRASPRAGRSGGRASSAYRSDLRRWIRLGVDGIVHRHLLSEDCMAYLVAQFNRMAGLGGTSAPEATEEVTMVPVRMTSEAVKQASAELERVGVLVEHEDGELGSDWEHLQQRLYRIWNTLEFSEMQRLDQLRHYSSGSRAKQFPAAVELWEALGEQEALHSYLQVLHAEKEAAAAASQAFMSPAALARKGRRLHEPQRVLYGHAQWPRYTPQSVDVEDLSLVAHNCAELRQRLQRDFGEKFVHHKQ